MIKRKVGESGWGEGEYRVRGIQGLGKAFLKREFNIKTWKAGKG